MSAPISILPSTARNSQGKGKKGVNSALHSKKNKVINTHKTYVQKLLEITKKNMEADGTCVHSRTNAGFLGIKERIGPRFNRLS